MKSKTLLLALSLGVALCTQWIRFTALLRLFPPELQLWDQPSINPGQSNDSISACLLLYADNHFLTEWLAFHYQTLPMRRLIDGFRPKIQDITYHHPILNRWQPFINITEWTDDDFSPSEIHIFITTTTSQFFGQARCNASVSAALPFSSNLCDDICKGSKKIFPTLRLQASNKNADEIGQFSSMSMSFCFPTAPGSFVSCCHPVKSEDDELPLLNHFFAYRIIQLLHDPALGYRGSCLGSNALRQMTSFSTNAEIEGLPSDVIRTVSQSQSLLLTWTWRQHGELHNHTLNKARKSMIDLGTIPFSALRLEEVDVHRPVMNCCTLDDMWIHNIESPFIVHHYVGTLRQFTFRDDPRSGKRTVASYAEYQNVNAATLHPWDSHVWFVDFVQTVGEERDTCLIQGVGEVVENTTSPILSEDESYEMLKLKVLDGNVNATSFLFPFRQRGPSKAKPNAEQLETFQVGSFKIFTDIGCSCKKLS